MSINIDDKVVEKSDFKDDKVLIYFKDGTYLELEISRYNTSCSCHPEYDYSIDATLY